MGNSARFTACRTRPLLAKRDKHGPDSTGDDPELRPVCTMQTGQFYSEVIMVPNAERIIQWARRHQGVREQPPGSNDGAGLRFMLKETNFEPGDKWCMFFAEACIKAGFEGVGPIPEYITHTGSCAIAARNAEAADKLSKWAAKGAIVLFRSAQGVFHHCGIVTEINENLKEIKSIQGNTNPRGSFSGGMVDEHWNSMAGCEFIIW